MKYEQDKLQETYTTVVSGTMYTASPLVLKAINRFVTHGKTPGGFTQALLTNNLSQTIMRADPDSLANLYAYVKYLHWHIPGNVFGSVKAVRDHIHSFLICVHDGCSNSVDVPGPCKDCQVDYERATSNEPDPTWGGWVPRR